MGRKITYKGIVICKKISTDIVFCSLLITGYVVVSSYINLLIHASEGIVEIYKNLISQIK